jgi:hypothetical protein
MDRVRIKKDIHQSTEHKPQGKTAHESGPANMQQALANPEMATPGDMLTLQQTAGNSAVAGWMQCNVERPEPPARAGGVLGSEFSASVAKARGSGMPLPPVLREDMAHSLGSEFGSVRLHTDDQADALAERIQARAFTTGPDIFFRKGAYSPNTPAGKQTLKHELAHVVQQGGASSSQLTLGPVNDVHEQEAERLSYGETAHPLASQPSTAAPAGAVQRFFFPWQKHKMEKLGGSANTVFKVKHREGNTGYLKPNSEFDPRMGARSVLSSDIDQNLGTNALSRETYQNYGPGMEGSESGEVKGSVLSDNEFNTPITKEEYTQGTTGDTADPSKFKMKKSGPFGLRKKYFRMSGTKLNTHDFTNPVTQKGLSNIQLNDAITGQNDRHGGNIKIDPVTHEAKGYDNDLMDIQGSSTITRMKGLHKPADGAALSPEQEAVRQAKRKEALGAVNTHFGKLVGLPSHIDRASAERMVGQKSSAFIADLQARNSDNMARLKPESISELKNRYSSVRRYAKAGMAAAGLVNDPAKAAKWSSPAYQQTVREGAGMVPHIVGPGGWNQNTYDEQVSKYAGEHGTDYQGYLQRSVLNYNDAQRAGGSITGGGLTTHLDNLGAPALRQPAMQGPPALPAPPPPAAVHAPPPPPPEAVHDEGPGTDHVRRLREIYENLARR